MAYRNSNGDNGAFSLSLVDAARGCSKKLTGYTSVKDEKVGSYVGAKHGNCCREQYGSHPASESLFKIDRCCNCHEVGYLAWGKSL